ncbi:uncharacterized protein BT62DRAFT_612267 [Guyanagaster necrorhizus]|uniref:DUF6699 domain-containing protein n=1 Tax=Guyanagaster necrorhizus TaxID=856835 RepID=A0A9P7W1X7_9AGAR|nr:uncharacterized protein BT62DRAFT_612267 [Guyanagaster necrorhizus MCA 3950]KAG7449876.1 hypothetical protein BT62DRAFT_612267 [Guyanagaster necrorhizus MCA 3950]
MQQDSPPDDWPWVSAPVIVNNPRNFRHSHDRRPLNNDGNQITPDFPRHHEPNHRSTGFCSCPICEHLRNPAVIPSPAMFTAAALQPPVVPGASYNYNWGQRLYDPTPPVVPREYLDNPSPPVIPDWTPPFTPPNPVIPESSAPVSPPAPSTPPVVPFIPPSPVIPTPPPLSEITLHYQLRQQLYTFLAAYSGYIYFPALHWDIVHPPNTARFVNNPTAFGVASPDFHASAFTPDTVRNVPCTSRHPILQYWMSPGRWGPLVIHDFDTITVREVLQQIFTYLHSPLTEVEVNWISQTRPNRNRLELAKFHRNLDVFGWQPLDGTFLRSDLLGGHRRFRGLEMVLEHGEWKLCVDFIAGPVPRLWDTI